MNAKEQFVLDCLADNNWWFGLDLIEKSNGLLKRGTVYVTLAKMEEEGLIESLKVQSYDPMFMPRRAYHLSKTGTELATK